MSAAMPIGVLVVDDHPVVRRGLGAIIETQADMRVAGFAATAGEALDVFARTAPDVTLMDLRLEGASGIDVAARILAGRPKARVIMFTSFARYDEIYEALKAGALSYLRKGSSPEELLQAIRTVHAGGRYVPAEIALTVAEHVGEGVLSVREREVLQLVFDGHSNKQIASRLGLSELTVAVHVKNILSKLGVGSRTEAVSAALRKGILRLEE
jgi:two-component system, NarL family, response regulator